MMLKTHYKKKRMFKTTFFKLNLFVFAGFLMGACNPNSSDENNNGIDDFDRSEMLKNYAEHYIIPGFESLQSEVVALKNASNSYVSAPTNENLANLRNNFSSALNAWQKVSFINFGPSGNINLRAQINVYPTNTTAINTNIQDGNYSFSAANNFSAKGFQAVDYLIYGIKSDDATIHQLYSDSSAVGTYLKDVVEEMSENVDFVVSEWSGSYKATFIANSTSNAQGSAVSEMMNNLSQHYETYVRKGKLGLPLGIGTFSQTILEDHVEAYYQGTSLPYLKTALTGIEYFIEGKSLDGSSDGSGLAEYLDFVDAQSNGTNLSEVIQDQFENALSEINDINAPLSDALNDQNTDCNEAYQELQKLVPLIKVNMTSALGVQITYQDNDGD